MVKAKTQERFRRPIILSIETKVREFPGKVLLSCFLAELGFRVLLTNHRRIKETDRSNAWLFIDRNTFANRIPFFKKLTKRGVKIACLDEEGIVWANPGIYLKRLNHESMDMTSLFLTWGPKQTALVEQVRKKTMIMETGNPRMDLLRPELRIVYQQKADELKQKYGDFIVVASNFAWNNHYYVDGENSSPEAAYIDLRRRQGLITTTEDEEFHRETLKYKSLVFEKIKELVRDLSNRFPEITIIVRPHPSENHEAWKSAMSGQANVLVLFEGELEPWIIAARAVIHNSCTSGVLSALLNRTSIAYMPYNDVRFEHEMPNSVSAQATNIEEVVALVKKSPIVQEVPSLLKDYISATDGKFASERIADAILSEAKKRPLINQVSLLDRIVSLILSILVKIRLIKKKNTTETEDLEARRNYKAQKFESLNVEEVNEHIMIYAKFLKRFDGIYAKRSHDLIEIRLK